jgi:hypothetical protein
MAASRLHCWMCGTTFYGRADARYCRGACRQKAYRAAVVRRAAAMTVPKPELGSTAAQARQTVQQARAARRRAGAARRAAAKTLAEVARQSKPKPQ